MNRTDDPFAQLDEPLEPSPEDLAQISGPNGHDPDKPKVPSWPEPVSAASLCLAPPPTPNVLIDGILYDLGTMLVSGPSKSHKTFTALDVGIAIADGQQWLGHKTVKSPVLYLNLELQAFSTADRIQKICGARGTLPPENLHIWNLRGEAVDLVALTANLPAMVAKLAIKVVCIDPHYKISSVSGMEENSNDDQGKLLTLMEGLCHKAGAALILTHHFAKGDASGKNAIDRASGGGVFARWGDVMMTFTPHDDEDCMTVEMALRNFAPVDPFVVRWEYPRWQRDDQMDPKNLKTSRGAKETFSPDRVFEVLEGLMGFEEWRSKAGKMSKSTFIRKVKDLTDEGRVEKAGMFYRKTAKVS